jgi:4-hydroxybenzoate polyprenyltransferase
MMILKIIISTILMGVVYILMEKRARKSNKDLFKYGYYTGLIIMIILNIVFN